MYVKVKHSPYHSVKVGERGTVTTKLYEGTTMETWRVVFDNKKVESRLFRKEELEGIDG